MKRLLQALIGVCALAAIGTLFYIGEFVTHHIDVLSQCDPPDELNCEDANLAGKRLMNLSLLWGNFKNANFTGADLTYSNFQGADMSGANFSNANLQSVTFFKTILNGANFSNASLKETDMSGADLRNANFRGADLTGAQFDVQFFEDYIVADTSGALLENTAMPDGAIISGVMGKVPTNTIPNPQDAQASSDSQDSGSSQESTPSRTAISLHCRDGELLEYCQVYWSDGAYRYLPFGVGPRQGGVVDRILYYDLGWNPSCILLYADGSIMTTIDLSKCN